MEKVEEQFAKNLRLEIEASEFTKSKLASLVGIAPSTLSDYLSGKTLPSLTVFAKLCKVLKCPSDELLGLKNDYSMYKMC